MIFIDDIVGIEEEKGHDEVVENVVKRLTEIDLYVKLEKYKWKIRKVEFLEVVISHKFYSACISTTSGPIFGN